MTASRDADLREHSASPPRRRAAHRRVATALALYRRRGHGPDVRDRVLTVYAAVLIAAMLGTAVVRGIVLWLDQPQVLADTDPSRLGGPALLAVVLLLVGAVLLGRVQGPAPRRAWMLSAFFASPVPLSAALRRPLAVTASVTAVVFAAAAAVPAGVLAAHGSLGGIAVAGVVMPAASLGVVVVAVWLWSQTAHAAASFGAAAVLALGVGIGWLVRDGTKVPLPLGSPVVPAVAVVVAGLCWASTGALLNRLHPTTVLAQSQRLALVRMLSTTGDLAAAAAQFHRPPGTGRRLRAAPLLHGGSAVLATDLIALLRSPARLIWSVVFAIGGGALLAGGVVSGSAAYVGVGAAVAYLASASWCSGLHHAADAAGRPALYGTRPSLLVLQHGLAPLVVAVVTLTVGAASMLLGAAPENSAGRPLVVLGLAIWAGALAALLRVYDAARGPLPVGLLLPVPTPVGDVSILGVLAWQADALIMAVLAPALVALLATVPTVAATVAAVATALVVALTAGRLSRLHAA